MKRLWTILFLAGWFPVSLWGVEKLTFKGLDFQKWNYPEGLIQVQSDGIDVKCFPASFNAVANTDEFVARQIGVHGERKIRTPSNPETAELLADQDVGTWWKPDPADPPDKWWVEIDLGRLVAAKKIRLIFPDTLGARPFAFFSVYSSVGLPLRNAPDKIRFERVGRAVNNNTNRVVEFVLSTPNEGRATGDYLVTRDSLDFRLMRFVRFEASGRTPDAALAEIEVETIGFNLATKVAIQSRVEHGLEVWGGKAWTAPNAAGPEGLIDGDLAGRSWAIESIGVDWRHSGAWWVVDLGSIFRINRIIWLPLVQTSTPLIYGFDRGKQCNWLNVDFLTSDGTPSNLSDPDMEGPYQYDLLTNIDNLPTPRSYIFDLQFPPRKARYVFWRRVRSEQICWALQCLIFHSEGYPAQVELESEDMDLGGARSIRTVEWDADLPPHTRIEVLTQTGNGYQTITRYFLKNGKEVSKAAYEKAKRRNRGPIVQDQVRDATWSDWSAPHRFSGQDFLSPTPRRWLKVRIRLISEDPKVMPRLRSLSFLMNTPVVDSGLSGEVFPHRALVDSLQDFRYLIWPNRPDPRNTGFDQVRISMFPEARDVEFREVRVAGEPVEVATEMEGDSLLIVSLPPPPVKEDTVEIAFKARMTGNPMVFDASVLNSAVREEVQGVVPLFFGANRVMAPELVFHNLKYNQVFSPNGDGINDFLRLSFTLERNSRKIELRIFSLDGMLVAEQRNSVPTTGRTEFVWSGESADGGIVPPGIYVLQLKIETTDEKEKTMHKLVHVVY